MNKKEILKEETHQVLIISQNARIVNELRSRILSNTQDKIGLLTNSDQLKNVNGLREAVINKHLQTVDQIAKLIQSQDFDIVYLDAAHEDHKQVKAIVSAAKRAHVKRLILMLSANESQDQNELNQLVSEVKKSNIKYTIIRAATISKENLLSYQVVKNAQPNNESSVPARSVADLVYQIIKDPNLQANVDLGITQLPYK